MVDDDTPTTPAPTPTASEAAEADAPADSGELLDPGFIRQLDQLTLASKKMFMGHLKGERRSPRRGQSVEFADYRNYIVGDELRFVDWNVFARLDRLFLKLFMEEEDLHVSVILDASGSMAYGNPEKLLYAKRVAAALCYIGLCRQDRVSVHVSRDGLYEHQAGLRSRRAAHRLFGFLQDIRGEGATDLTTACREFALRQKTKGVVVLLSDFLDRQGYEEPLRYLLMGRSDIVVLQVLSPEEMEPDLPDDLRLLDLEDGRFVDVSRSEKLLEMYQHTLEAFTGGLREACARRGIAYIFARTDTAFDTLVLKTMRQYRVVQ